MFTDKAECIINSAKEYAYASDVKELVIMHIIMATGNHPEGMVLLAECTNLTADHIRKIYSELPEPKTCLDKFPLSDSVRAMFSYAKNLADEVPDGLYPGQICLRHIVCALSTSKDACSFLKITPMTKEDAIAQLNGWYERGLLSPGLEDLTERLRSLRGDLLEKVYGQDHAVHTFVEGLFNAEVVAAADTSRKAPRAIFIFAGPPGVGKTFLAELGASCLERPFKRFDMSAYSGHQQSDSLIGMAKSFHGAHLGQLTEFVEQNPNAILLFDEIEKSHQNTIHLFLQILDAGTLEDKYNERNVAFRDTIIIFTTNAGRKLYNRPNMSGVHSANASFHRKTILDALENETDPNTRQPFFPSAICSRMSTGYPIMFNHLRVNELEKVVEAEITRIAGLLEQQYYKEISFDDLLQMCLVLREGSRADARTLRSQAENFVKNEIFKFCQLFKADRLEDVLEQVDRIRFVVQNTHRDMEPEVRALFEQLERPRILLVADSDLTHLYQESITEIDWQTASSPEDALQILANEEIDMVLLDLWFGRSMESFSGTIENFDHVPMAARSLDLGQELLRKIHDRLPQMPVYLLSLAEEGEDSDIEGSIDEELFMACVRAGGASGMVISHFIDGMVKGWEKQQEDFTAQLLEISRRLYREKQASKMGQERKVLTFDTAPHLDKDTRKITIRLRNLRITRAVAAADVGEVLEDVERPRVRFDDVIGAGSAKEELKFFIDYLKNPRRFSALGLKPPKGVLLHGPPGTGKTMLARAMAGESDVAFISAAASSFVTMWQGSGPQSIRDLFERARRYAPAIVFIDEIDAIGKVRTGSVGGAQATENTLNALLTELDGFTSPSADRPVFVLAATNFKIEPESQDSPERSSRTLDPALVRRFSSTILVGLPDTAARKKYLLKRISDNPNANISESAIELLAEKSVGMSIANLEGIIEAAGRIALKKDTPISDEMLIEAMDTAREGEAKEWSPEFLESTARHEAGHTVMYWLSGWLSPEISIVARADHGGGMRRCEAEMKRESLTREEMLARIRTCLGGRAAEILHFGKEKGMTTGAAGDLETATNIARQMICRYGMDEEFGLLATPELFKHAEAISSPIYQQVNQTVSKILMEQMNNTIKMLEENLKYVDAIAKDLMKHNRILRSDLEKILQSKPNIV